MNSVNRILAVFAAIVGPLFEELIFRGILYTGFRRNGSALQSIVLTAVLFGLFHMTLNQMVYATSIEIQGALNHQMAVTKGQVYQLNAKVLPNNVSSNEVLWYIYEWKTPNDTKAGAVSLSLDGRLQCYDVCTFTVRCVPRVAKKESGLYDWVTINVVE